MRQPKVIVSHGGVQYSYQLALAMQELGVLEKFYTTFCYTNDHWVGRLVEALPTPHRQRMLSYLRRRAPGGIETKRMCEIAWPEFVRRAGSIFFGKNYFTSNRLLEWQNRAFDASVAARLKKQRFDVLIALSGSSLKTMEMAKRRGRVVVLDQHDIHFATAERLLHEEMERSPEFADTITYWPPVQSYLRTLEREIDIADYICVPSTFALRSHLEHGVPKEKLLLMPHATEPTYESLARQRRPDGIFRILFVGTITQRKGIKYLLDAVLQLGRTDVELVLVGDKVGSQVPMQEYSKYVRWVPYVEHVHLRDYFDEADVFVLPTLYDAFGLSALEAMAAGLPVIVSENCVAGSDVVRDGIDGFVVPIRDPEAIAVRLAVLIDDAEKRERMGVRARERVAEFNWLSYKNRWQHFIDGIGSHAT